MADDSITTRFRALAIALLMLLASACMAFAITPQAYADDIKPEKAMLQIDSFATSEAIDVSKQVATIDVSSPDTLFKLTITDRYSRALAANKDIEVYRKLVRYENGAGRVVTTVKNSDTLSFKAEGMKKGDKLDCLTITNAIVDADGKVTGMTPTRALDLSYRIELNTTLVDFSEDKGLAWELGGIALTTRSTTPASISSMARYSS